MSTTDTRTARRPSANAPRHTPPGLPARKLAVDLIGAILAKGRTLDDALAWATGHAAYGSLPTNDRGLARLIAATVMRRLGQLDAIIDTFIDRPLPANSGSLRPILYAAAAQLVFLGIAPHAVINLAVEQTRSDPRARRFDRLTNAVLRRVSERGLEIAATQDAVRLNIPDWLWESWTAAYGEPLTRAIAEASLREAPLDITAKSDAQHWAQQLEGLVLPTGSIRRENTGRVEDLPGFAEGAWWVQDAAAALPVKLLGDVAGQQVADLCAAPGGKTCELAAAGAHVTSVDISAQRLRRLRENLARLNLEAEIIEADVATWQPDKQFDAVVLDAPCLATGTIRRHPDILRLKRAKDVERLAQLQARLLSHAAELVRPGGLLVYCTCSLEPEEGHLQVDRLLADHAGFERVPVTAAEIDGEPDWITSQGDLRTLPSHLPMETPELSGMDGFFAARLRRKTG